MFLAYLLVFILIAPMSALMFVAFRNYERSKRAVIEGMAKLDQDYLEKLGWTPTSYISTWDFRSPFKYGWHSWGLLTQQQNVALQRVFLHGLPKASGLLEDTKKSARKFRLLAFAIVVFCIFFFVPSFIGLSRAIAEFTGTLKVFWYALFLFCICSWVFLPIEKFKKWPEIEVHE